MTGRRPRPAAEIDITADLVRSLVASVRPDLADLRLAEVGEGWDNSVWRLGEDLSVRVPRRGVAVELLVNEQRWLPTVAGHLPLPVPTPVIVGAPTGRFPWPWSICRWVPGRTWVSEPPEDEVGSARRLGEFLVALHRPAPEDAPRSPFRGGPLSSRDELVRARLELVAGEPDGDALLGLWCRALAAEDSDTELRSWVHGDLHPLNLACRDGGLAGVLDFGDLTAGDPAVDLSSGWTVLDRSGRGALFERYGADAATVVRAAGWALNHGLACVAGSSDHVAVAEMGRRTLRRLLEDPPT